MHLIHKAPGLLAMCMPVGTLLVMLVIVALLLVITMVLEVMMKLGWTPKISKS